jgi:transcriptional regulator with XRE-family HTH domain
MIVEGDAMTPNQVKSRRLELGLTIPELAFALNVDEMELRRIETGESAGCCSPDFEEAFALLEERVFGLLIGV